MASFIDGMIWQDEAHDSVYYFSPEGAAASQACAASSLTSGGWSGGPRDVRRPNGDVVPRECTFRDNPGFDELFVNGRSIFCEHNQPSLWHFPRKTHG